MGMGGYVQNMGQTLTNDVGPLELKSLLLEEKEKRL